MRSHRWKLALALALLAAASGPVRASEDTDTPGAGRWEINLGLRGQSSAGLWELAAPEADVNYGWGECTQLMLALQRLELHARGQPRRTGMGSATIGLKWRFADQEQAGLDLALLPSYSRSVSSGAVRRGLLEPGDSLVLPLVAGIKTGATGWYAEAGRNFVENGADEWLAGFKLTHPCLPSLECRFEIQRSLARGQLGHTESGVGLKWRISDELVLQASAARDVHPRDASRHQLIVKTGIQLLR